MLNPASILTQVAAVGILIELQDWLTEQTTTSSERAQDYAKPANTRDRHEQNAYINTLNKLEELIDEYIY